MAIVFDQPMYVLVSGSYPIGTTWESGQEIPIKVKELCNTKIFNQWDKANSFRTLHKKFDEWTIHQIVLQKVEIL